MRKFICTADIHISIKKDVPEEWQLDRYVALFETLIAACKEHKADLIIAGDLFDKSSPTLDDLFIVGGFFEALKNNDIQTYIIAGNHCTLAKNDCTFNYLMFLLPPNISWEVYGPKLCGNGHILHFANHAELSDDYERRNDIMQFPGDKHTLITHFRTTVGEYIREEIDTRKLCDQFDLVIAGDIHSDFEEGNLVYTNQPINSKFESQVNTGYLLLTLDDYKDPSWERITTTLPALRQINCSVEDFADLEQHFSEEDFYRVAVTGSLKELRDLKCSKPNVKLQKIPVLTDILVEEIDKTSKVDTLPLDAQLVEYLKILQYSEDKINALLNIWKES